jgi:predicted Zn-dependent protease
VKSIILACVVALTFSACTEFHGIPLRVLAHTDVDLEVAENSAGDWQNHLNAFLNNAKLFTVETHSKKLDTDDWRTNRDLCNSVFVEMVDHIPYENPMVNPKTGETIYPSGATEAFSVKHNAGCIVWRIQLQTGFTKQQTIETLEHELGHVIGLDHNLTNPKSILYPTGNGGQSIQPEDVDNAEEAIYKNFIKKD